MKKEKTEKKHIMLNRKELSAYMKENKLVSAVYITLRIIVLFTLVRSIMLQNFENAAVCLLVLVLLLIPAFIEKNLGINIPTALEIILMLFIFASEILGELQSFFVKIPFWDTMLHTTAGFMLAAFGFMLIDILNNNGKIKFTISPFFVSLVAFCFSMTMGVIWEFFEFGMDRLFSMDMQKDTVISSFFSTFLDPTHSNIAMPYKDIVSTAVNGELLPVSGYLDIGLYDTMEDLFVNFIGAFIFCIIGYFFIVHRGKGKLSEIVPTYNDNNNSEKS